MPVDFAFEHFLFSSLEKTIWTFVTEERAVIFLTRAEYAVLHFSADGETTMAWLLRMLNSTSKSFKSFLISCLLSPKKIQ